MMKSAPTIRLRNRCCLLGFAIVFVAGLAVGDTSAALLTNSDFETIEVINDGTGWPTTTGDWANDGAAIVTTENGITPQSGLQMLRFISSNKSGLPSGLQASQVHQLFDLAPFAAQVATGNLLATASYWANRVGGDAQTNTEFTIGISAMTGLISDFPTVFGPAGWGLHSQAEGGLFSDGDVSTWEKVTVNLLIPVGSDYLEVNVAARENIFNNTTTPEYDGHYGDNVSFTLTAVPEPSSLIYLALGTVGLMAIERRRRKRNMAP